MSAAANQPAALAGRSIVCTGGGSGIGRAAIHALLAAGASISVLERDEAKCDALVRLGDRVAVVHGDATTAADNERLVHVACERFGRIDAAITFVGIFDFYTPLTELPSDRFDDVFTEIFDLNVKSPLLTARAVAPALRDTKGTIIFTLSSSSFFPGRGGTLYVASKHAMRGAVAQLAHELAPDVRVNAVAPGGTLDTDLRGPRTLGLSEERLADRSGRAAELKARTPLNVALTSADHAGIYVFLASDAAQTMTGEILRSDGGLSAR